MQVNSNNPPEVTVVIPVYNSERYIVQTIESVFAQSYKNISVIVVDDGSNDNSALVILECIKFHPEMQFIRQKNAGVSMARNAGLQAAKGEMILFLDADDIMLIDNIHLKVDFLIRHENAFGISSWCEIIDENSKLSGEVKVSDPKINLDDVLEWRGNYITIPSGILFRTELIRETGGFCPDLSNNADQEIIMRLLNNRFDFYSLQKVTWQYRRHVKNMSSDMTLTESDTLKCYELAGLKNYFHSSAFKNRCLCKVNMILAASWLKNGKNLTKSVQRLNKAISFSPLFVIDYFMNRLFDPQRWKRFNGQ